MPNVLVSVSNKDGIIDFVKVLHSKGWSCIASGTTAKVLQQANLPVTDVAEHTGSKEILGGRVKTLHPVIHGGILARPNDADKKELASLGIQEIDMVVVNLYPFEETIRDAKSNHDDCIESIDIGGVALLRAAAKNYVRVTTICEPEDYQLVANEIKQNNCVSIETRKKLAIKAFAHCTRYDAAITNWLSGAANNMEPFIFGFNEQALRYGENPHQKAALYSYAKNQGALGGIVLQGKELSYNNILDCDAAWKAVNIFDKPSAVVVKHLSPCGIAQTCSTENVSMALVSAIKCDPISAYGGIIAINQAFNMECFVAIKDLFVECIVAQSFADDVLPLLAKHKKLRLIKAPLDPKKSNVETRSVLGGFLRQEVDFGDPANTEYKAVTKKLPSKPEHDLLMFAWRSVLCLRSNAVAIASYIDSEQPSKGFCTIGLGMGQPNRVDSVRHAIKKALELRGDLSNTAMSSDAFFPFADSIEEAGEAGIKAIIQPGGSIRDNDSIDACNKYDMSMIFTGVRHFRH